VEIEIDVVKVPQYYTADDSDLFISGDFNDWSLRHPKYRLKKVSPSRYSIKLDLAEGDYKYKVSRGVVTYDRSSLECTSSGDKWQYRQLSVKPSNNPKTIIEVTDWEDYFGVHSVAGNVQMLTAKLDYPQLNATKEIYIYLPPDYYTSTTKTYSVVYLHDGWFNFDSYWDTPYGEMEADETMESFYEQRKEVSIVVGIPSTNRSMEYTPYPNYIEGMFDEVGGYADLYLDFLVNNLKPFIDRNLRTKPQREHTAIAGSSLGGLISFYGGLKYNEVFSRMGIYSATFVWNYTIYEWAAANLPRYQDTKLYFTAGSQEVADYFVHINMSADMLKMIDLLKSEGVLEDQIRYSIRDEGHTWSFWSREFPLTYSWWFYDY
jgi:predicted alpha/beta superfamily hydrolase